MIIYALFYSHDDGNREDWNVSYTPVELFSSHVSREKRIQDLTAQDADLEFETRDLTLDA
jgi:hypothetical protein